MKSINDTALESNKYLKFNFDGGDLSSDSGLLLIKEFISKTGIDTLIHKIFKTNDSAKSRKHKDGENLLQMLFQQIAGYFADDCADELTDDPVYTAILEKDSLASQPTLSRFFNRMDKDTLEQFNDINRELRAIAYSIEPPEMVLFDLDTTLLETHGKQEGGEFNYHYQASGYHPLLCYDGLTGDLLGAELRGGADYCSKDVCDFMGPLFDEYRGRYPGIDLFLRGDSGFATPGLYMQCEANDTSYVIKLKSNAVLKTLAADLESELYAKTGDNMLDYAVVFGEFYYRAGSWDRGRRVVCKVEKPAGQMIAMTTFIVTNMELAPEWIVRLYCHRGQMENFIKEGKNGFDLAAVSSHSETVNANRFQLRVLGYAIFNLFRRLVLPEALRKCTVDTIRLKLLKIAAKVVRSARYKTFKLCSGCPYKELFYKTLDNIRRLEPQPL